jgi:SH3-like domain-containing protein
MHRLLVVLIGLIMAAPTLAQNDGQPTPSGQAVPRFVSLKFDVANGRAGPSRAHPIAWRYVRAGLPMEVIAETPDWRRVRDPGGEITWMHRRVLSGRRSVFTLEETPLRARADLEAAQEVVADAGITLSLERCHSGWCRVEGQGFRGWAQAHMLWGVYPHERENALTQPDDGNPGLSTSLQRDTALP